MKSNWRLLLGRALEEHGESWSDVEASTMTRCAASLGLQAGEG